MLTQEKQVEDFSVSPNNTLEILLDECPGWTMSIEKESAEINHQEFGNYLVEEDGFLGYTIFTSNKSTFSSVLLAFIETPNTDIDVYVPHPSHQEEGFHQSIFDKPGKPIIATEVYESKGIKLKVNLF